jgi:hypothetical protein
MKKTIGVSIFVGIALGLAAFVAAEAETKASPPILVASCGQSQGPEMLSMMLRRVGVAYDIVPTATVKDLQAKPYKTLIVTMGASLKGMGAAGVEIDDELARTNDLIAAAKAAKITVIGAHIEGLKRRAQGASAGDTTDEQSIDAVAPKSDFLFVYHEGNSDGRFTTISQNRKIPMVEFQKNLDMVAELTKIFK